MDAAYAFHPQLAKADIRIWTSDGQLSRNRMFARVHGNDQDRPDSGASHWIDWRWVSARRITTAPS